MANKRVKDLTTDTSLSAGDYVLLDSASEGTRKFDLGTEIGDLKSDLRDIVTLTLSGGNIGSDGAVNVVPSSTYYLISQEIDVSDTGRIKISDYYYGPSISTCTILDENGTSIYHLLNPAGGQDYLDIDIPVGGVSLYVQATSAKTPKVEKLFTYSKNNTLSEYLVNENTPL